MDGIRSGLELRAAAKAAEIERLESSMAEHREAAANTHRRLQPYLDQKRDVENQAKIRDAILLQLLQEQVDAEIDRTPPTALEIEEEAQAENAIRQRAADGLGIAACVVGMISLSAGLLLLLLAGRPSRIATRHA